MTQKLIKDSYLSVRVGVPVTADTVALIATVAQNAAVNPARIPDPSHNPDVYLVFPDQSSRPNSYSQH